MKKLFIGSSGLDVRVKEKMDINRTMGHEVKSLISDNGRPDLNMYALVCENRQLIEWADEVLILWDGRDPLTMLYVGIAFGLRKEVRTEYIPQRTLDQFLVEIGRRQP